MLPQQKLDPARLAVLDEFSMLGQQLTGKSLYRADRMQILWLYKSVHWHVLCRC